MKVDFVKLSPTENMTVIVTSPVEMEKQLKTGTELIKYASVNAEQAGFLEKPKNAGAALALRMMAGEFCGNGTMSAAVYWAWKNGIKKGESISVPLEVSGADGVLECEVYAVDPENGVFTAEVDMPLPQNIGMGVYEIGGKSLRLPTVKFEGITHVIVPADALGGDAKKILEDSIYSVGKNIATDAFGLVLFDEEMMEMTPLVAVRSAGSLCWERGCGSGSEAVGAYLAEKYGGSLRVRLRQPGGIIEATVDYDGEIENIAIKGTVRIVAEGRAFAED